MKRMLLRATSLCALICVSLTAGAQTYSKTETVEYHDDASLWILDQVKRTTIDGQEVTRSEFGWKAFPIQVFEFGLLSRTLSYDTSSAISSGQLGTLTGVRDGNSNLTTFGLWRFGVPQSIRYADNSSATMQVDGNGWIVSTTNEAGSTNVIEYDPMGRIKRVQFPTNDTVAWEDERQIFEQIQVTEHGLEAGHWRQTTWAGNARKVTYFDAMWRPVLTHEYDAANRAGTQRSQLTEYDAAGRPVFRSYPSALDLPAARGMWTFYDSLGRVTEVRTDSELLNGAGQKKAGCVARRLPEWVSDTCHAGQRHPDSNTLSSIRSAGC
jgi:hypothetical protein